MGRHRSGRGGAPRPAHAPKWAASPVFRVKLALIALAGVNVLFFHQGVFRRWRGGTAMGRFHSQPERPQCAPRGLWVAVTAAGRLLAYL